MRAALALLSVLGVFRSAGLAGLARLGGLLQWIPQAPGQGGSQHRHQRDFQCESRSLLLFGDGADLPVGRSGCIHVSMSPSFFSYSFFMDAQGWFALGAVKGCAEV